MRVEICGQSPPEREIKFRRKVEQAVRHIETCIRNTRLHWRSGYSGFNEYCYSAPSICSFGSIFMPGPMVVVTVMRLMKLPFAPEGRALFTPSIKAA